MAFLTQYLLESSFCLLFFYILYHFLLRKETFFQLNRAYLLATPIISLLIPLVQIPLVSPTQGELPAEGLNLDIVYPAITGANALEETIWEPVHNQTLQAWPFSFGEVLTVLYLIGLTMMALRRGLILWKMIGWISAREKQTKFNGYTLVEVEGNYPAASFLNYILLNPKKAKGDFPLMLEHELVHVRQRHTLDFLVLEVLVLLFWFHPLIYLFRISLRETHEYIADQVVVQKVDPLDYARVLISHSSAFVSPVSTHSFHSFTQKRLIMLGQTPSTLRQGLKYFGTLPLLSILVLLFSFDLVEQIPDSVLPSGTPVETLLSKQNALTTARNSLGTIDEPEPAKKLPGESDGRIATRALDKQHAGLGAKKGSDLQVKDVVEQPIAQLPVSAPSLNSSVAFRTTSIPVFSGESQEVARKEIPESIKSEGDSTVLLIIDGEVIIYEKQVRIPQDLDPKDIESIKVLRGEAAQKRYPHENLYGVIEIKTKGKKKKARNRNQTKVAKVKPSRAAKIDDTHKTKVKAIPSPAVQVTAPFTVKVFPNVASEYASVQFQLNRPAESVSLTLIDLQGKKIKAFNLGSLPKGEYKEEINRADLNLSPGTFFLRLQVDGVAEVSRLVFGR
jgi:hypothetical protein